MRILVTGAAGFIGSNLVHYWVKNHPKDEIVVLDKLTYAGNLDNFKGLENNPNFTFIKGDINDYDLTRSIVKDCDYVLHLAAESHVDRSLSGPEAAKEFFQTNVDGTKTLLEAVCSYGSSRRVKKFIHMSTDEVWGELSDMKSKFHKGMSLDPTQPYSESKAEAQVLAHAYNSIPYPSVEYAHEYEDPLTIVINCTNAIGPRQFPEKMIPLSITNVLEGKPIRVYGEGKNIREWIFVEDLCRGFEAVILKGQPGWGKDGFYEYRRKDGETESQRGQQYLFGSGQEITNMELAKMILAKMGRPVIVSNEKEDPKGEATIHLVGDRPIHDLRYAIDYSDTTKELGWKPRYTLNQSLDATINWYTRNEDWWRPLKEGKRVIYEWELGGKSKER